MNIGKEKKLTVVMFILIICLLIRTTALAEEVQKSYTVTIDISSYAGSLKNIKILERRFCIWYISNDLLSEDQSISKRNELINKSKDELIKMYGEPVITNSFEKNGLLKINFKRSGTYYIRELEMGDKGIFNYPFILTLPMKNGEDKIYLKRLKPPQEIPSFGTGSFDFLKISDDSSEKNLEGAEFKVMKKIGDKYIPVKRDNKDYILTSNSNGKFTAEKLPFGKYYLWEVRSPIGYWVLSQPIEFSVEMNSDKKNLIKIKNRKNPSDIRKDHLGNPNADSHSRKGIIPKTGDVTLILMVLSGGTLWLLGYLLVKEGQIHKNNGRKELY